VAELGQLGDAVDELRHFRSEALLDVVEREVRVLGNVMEEAAVTATGSIPMSARICAAASGWVT